MTILTLQSPLSGWIMPLSEVPDPVFSGGMMGDGIAIDPTNDLVRAPCDGEVVSVAPTRHAVTLRALNGAELLIHVGIDTVALGGDGFVALAAAGQRVRAGDALLRFDLDAVARRAPSLVTPIIITNPTGYEVVDRRHGATNAGDTLLALRQTSGSHYAGESSDAPAGESADRAAAGSERDGSSVSRRVQVALAHGLHARPAALVARRSRDFDAQVAVRARGRAANASSAVALMSLGVVAGDEVDVEARGREAGLAVDAIASLIANELEAVENRTIAVSPLADRSPSEAPRVKAGDEVAGVVASRGYAIGRAYVLVRTEREVAEQGSGIAHESAALDAGRDAVRRHLESLHAATSGPRREIVEAHLEFLDDPQLDETAHHWIAQGRSAAYAWRRAVRSSVDALAGVEDARLRERADDLLDLEGQVLASLAGEAPGHREVPEGSVVVAAELLPSEFAALDPTRIAGICLAHGGATSHVAIMAAAAGVPMIVAAGPSIMTIAPGTWLLVDAETGRVRIDPSAEVREQARREVEARRARDSADRVAATSECRTADGVRIEILANVGSATEAETAVRDGAEGCGLLRTEFLFLERRTAPDADEQAAEYQRVVDAFGGRPVVIRTLDVGGDKPIDYLPMPREDNPALGMRGVRLSLHRPDLLRTQLAAILRVRPLGACRIMLPMVNGPDEIRRVRAVLDELAAVAPAHELPLLGVMVETPAAAMLAEDICEVADFLSIGTNDLTQYTLAMDRTHPDLASQLDGLHPAVLRLIARITTAAHARTRPVAVCGGLASDPEHAPLLVGLGVHELSVVSATIPRLKSVLRATTIEQCEALAKRALALDSAAAVRSLIRSGA